MAARTLLPRVAAGLVVGSVALVPKVAHADGPETQSRPRKSIYDDYDEVIPPAAKPLTPISATRTTPAAAAQPESHPPPPQPVSRGPTPTDRLAAQIRRARLFLHAGAASAEDSVNSAMDRAFALEQSFTSTIASLAPPRESGERLMPGLIYVLVAAMAGSIVSRGRNVVLRASAPLAFGVAAGWAVLPVTMRKVGDLAWTYERRFPAVADAHVRTRERLERAVYMARLHSRLGVQYVEDKVGDARETVESWVRKGK